MRNGAKSAMRWFYLTTLLVCAALPSPRAAWAGEAAKGADKSMLPLLDAPLLFVKRHAYMAPHIYDDFYTWHPGGGIYVIENPADGPAKHRIRTVIDATTKVTLGEGVYRDANLSWDAKRIVFAYKGENGGDTSIYEIGVDGRNLRRLTPSPSGRTGGAGMTSRRPTCPTGGSSSPPRAPPDACRASTPKSTSSTS